MPTLPGLNIEDQAVYDRIVAAFGTLANYRAWHRNQLREFVTHVEGKAQRDQTEQEIGAALNSAT